MSIPPSRASTSSSFGFAGAAAAAGAAAGAAPPVGAAGATRNYFIYKNSSKILKLLDRNLILQHLGQLKIYRHHQPFE